MDLTLSTPVQYVPRVGPARAKLLAKLGLETVRDLLYYIPFRYDDFSIVSPIARVRPGETVTVGGTVTAFHNAFTKSGKKLQEVKVGDETGILDVIWFNQPFLVRVLPVGTQVRLAGKIDWYGHKLVMSSPSYEVTGLNPVSSVSIHTGRLVPVYSETAGLTSKWLRGRIAFILETTLKNIIDAMPGSIQSDYHLMPLAQAIQTLHFPESIKQTETARRKLVFDELFYLQLRAWEERRIWENSKKSYVCRIDEPRVTKLISSLPFTLTDDQQTATREILNDLTRSYPMNRLLEGDVGAGKTVVAMIAMYVAHLNGSQSVLMAPTQILAEQHFATINGFLEPFGVQVGLVTGSQKIESARIASPPRTRGSSAKLNLDSRLRGNDKMNILIGTHALLSKTIKYQRLGLVVIDEQQRFGVLQRSALEEITKRGKTPHLLTMTATPIPRTIARTIMGNLDLSVLATIPDGRKKIKTWVVPNEKREKAYQWIIAQIDQTGGQVFVICPLIEQSETLVTAKAATSEYARLQSIFPKFQLGLLHGRMKPKEKNAMLDAFRQKKIQILVATPVVEVGIDIPNASIMLIEAAERFGLSQLHQLRGRVGRGDLQSYCLLFTEQVEEQTLTRLKSMETTHSGPLLAEIDLRLRGPGELFGTRQHGIPDLHIARWTDTEAIAETQQVVRELVREDPTLSSFPLLRDQLGESTIKSAHQD